MDIPKDKIIEMRRERGADDKVQQTEQELPDQVDPEQHPDLLQKLGIDPQDRLGGIGERLGLRAAPDPKRTRGTRRPPSTHLIGVTALAWTSTPTGRWTVGAQHAPVAP